MKNIILACLAAIGLLVGCGGQKTASPAEKAKIERCWKSAGISGDLYRFLTPEQAAGLQAAGGVSETQAAVFKQCLSS